MKNTSSPTMAVISGFLAILILHYVQAEIILPEDTGLSPLELIAKYGYPLERHWVTTEDGYILNMHRIPHGLNNAGEGNRPAILLMHGLLSSGADFINRGHDGNLGFLLADMGYDVWLGNARGTTYSRNHTTLNPDEKEFWQFTWHEIGYYDLAAKIDYIIETSGQEKIFYIGHSQGTTISYVLASQRPEYNDKLRLIMSFAPVAYMKNLINPLFLLAAPMYEEIGALFESLGIYEVLPHFESTQLLKLCADGSEYQDICVTVLSIVCGYDREQANAGMMPVFITNAPAGISYKQLLHYAQLIRSGGFSLYDHGVEENLKMYGQELPPDYDLSKITAPVALFYSKNDWIAATVDVERLFSELGNGAVLHLNSYSKFNHIDYIWATDIVSLLYEDVFNVMSQY